MEQDECCVCYEIPSTPEHKVYTFKCMSCNEGFLCLDCMLKIANQDVVICPICRTPDFKEVMFSVHHSITYRFPTVSPRVEKFLQSTNPYFSKSTLPVFKKVQQTLDLYPTDWYLEIWSAYFVMDIMLRLGYCAI
jgi:hypothetical protein